MGYLSLLTLLCLSLLLVMSSEGMHHMKKLVDLIMQRNTGAKKCVIIRPLTEGEAAPQKATSRDPVGWKVKRVSCAPTTVKGLSEDCSSKIRKKKDIDLLVFDVFHKDELRRIQYNLAIDEPPQIEFFVRSKRVLNHKTSTFSWEVKLLDIEQLIRKGYYEKDYGNFVEFSRKGETVSYYGKINWEIENETDLKFKEENNTKSTFLFFSFMGTISKNLSALMLKPRGSTERSDIIFIKELRIPENTKGTFKPMEGQTTIPFNFEHNFETDKELQITKKKNYFWVATK